LKPKLLVATNIDNINGLYEKLESQFEIVYYPNLEMNDLSMIDSDLSAIFTNPNNLKVYFGQEVLSKFKSLKTLATASTGTIHIDRQYVYLSGIKLISITESFSVLEKITSTAEHAFLLTLSALRHYDAAVSSVRKGLWDYSPYVGRQMNALKIGVVGYGRLGKMYSKFCSAFDAQVVCCDPFKQNEILADGYRSQDIFQIFESCDVVSLHIHATPENINLINSKLLQNSKPNQVLINTSRGEIVDEIALLRKIDLCENFRYYTDVLSEEHRHLSENALFNSKSYDNQVVITPHCGGMTTDARALAFHHAADLLGEAHI
tara:strand:+ start:63 stop:1019 length:957 start_codon:yes stop_codon:yes gene_type:complete